MKKKRILAGVLAIAMAVSSLPMGIFKEAKSVEAAETVSTASADKVLIWDGETGWGSYSYQYSEDGYHSTGIRSFQSPSLENFTIYRPDVAVNKEYIAELLKGIYDLPEDIEVSSWGSPNNTWMVTDKKGEAVETLNTTSSWPTINKVLSSADPTGKWYFRCITTLPYVRMSNGDYYYMEDLKEENYITEDSYTLQYDLTISYTGPTRERIENGEIKMSDYVAGLDELEDQMFVYLDDSQTLAESCVYSGSSFSDSTQMDLSSVKVDSDYDDYMSINSKWYAYSVDGDKLELIHKAGSGTSVGNVDAEIYQDFVMYDEAGNVTGSAIRKTVDYYVCEMIVYHGSNDLAEYAVKFDLEKAPFKYNPGSGESEVVASLNGTATLDTNVEVLDTENCNGVMYQWYKIAKDGTETLLKGQNAKSLKVRVKDFDTKYKCEYTAKFKEGYEGEPYTASGIFKIAPSVGYRIKDITDEYVYLSVGESATMFIEAEVNDGYSLSYRWLEGSSGAAFDSFVECGTGNSHTITVEKESDFNKRYYLEVIITKGTKEIERYLYYYYLYEEFYKSRSYNTGTTYALRGEDVELYVDYEVADSITVSKQWMYCFEQSTYYTSKYDSSLGRYVYIFEDGYEPPADDAYDYRKSTSIYKNGSWKYYFRYYKYINPEKDKNYSTDEDGNLIVKGKDSKGNVLETEGTYACLPTYIVNDEEAEEPREEVASTLEYTIVYKSNLSVRVKDANVKAPVGTSATLQVMANNDNQEVYPISYSWEKLDAATGKYVVVEEDGEAINKDAYEIASVSNADYGTYRVTIDDTVESKEVTIALTEKALDYTIYTPEISHYYANIGDEITFQVDADVENNMEIYYEWYQQELLCTDNDDWNDKWVYTELVGQEGNTCTVTIDEPEDFDDYKCILTFKTADANGNPILLSEEVYFYVQPKGEFNIVPMSSVDEYKKVGSSRTYTVKPVTDIVGMDNSKINYRWQVNGEKVEGVTGSTYSVASLKKEDFGTVTVYADYVDGNGIEYTDSYSFHTYMFTDFAIENSGTTKKVVLGTDVTLAPEFSKEPTGNVTYQWAYYRYENYTTKYIDIAGATSKEYVIPNVSSGDLEKYRCTIWVDGVQIGTYFVTLAEDIETADITLDYAEGTQRYMDVRFGETVTLGVVAESNKNLDLKYQWYKGYWSEYGIGGATESTLTIANITPEDIDDYRCIVTDSQGNTNYIRVELEYTTGLAVNSDAWASNYYLGYETTLGGSATLAVNATIDAGNEIFYQWRKLQEDGSSWDKIYGQNASTFTLSNITEGQLGKYSCVVSDAYGESITVLFVVYIDTGLVTIADAEDVLAEADGSVKMSVSSRANTGYTISYQWAKKQVIKKGDPSYDVSMDTDSDGEYEGYVNIPNAVSNTYGLTKITKADYGTYRVTVSTRGESYDYFFYLNPIYNLPEKDKDFAEEGEVINLAMKIDNAAVDENYTYEWWATEPSTNNKRKVNCATATLSTTAPNITHNKMYNGYYNVTYLCKVKDADGNVLASKDTYVTVIPTVTYSTSLPESEHPFGKAYDIQGYHVAGAESLTVTFDAASELNEEELYVVNGAGKGMSECYHGEADSDDGYDCDCAKFCMNGEKEHTITIEGDRAIFLLTHNTKKDSYGYKVKSIDVKWAPGKEPASGSAIKTVKKKISIGLKETVSVKAKNATYKSNKKKVAKVTKKGAVTGLKTGKAKVTVKTKTKKIIYTITVKKAPKKIQKVTPAKMKLKLKKKAKIKVKLPKGTASYNITYTTSNKKVATVTKKGVVKAKKKGKCKITVMTYNGKKKTVKVTVKK